MLTSSKRVIRFLVAATASSTFCWTFLEGSRPGSCERKPILIPSAGLASPKKVLVHPRHDPQQRRLASAIGSQHADLGAGIERQVDALQHLLVRRVNAPEVLHGEDVLVSHRARILAACTANGQAAGSDRAAWPPRNLVAVELKTPLGVIDRVPPGVSFSTFRMHRLPPRSRTMLAVLVTVAGCGGGGGSSPDASPIEVDGDGGAVGRDDARRAAPSAIAPRRPRSRAVRSRGCDGQTASLFVSTAPR